MDSMGTKADERNVRGKMTKNIMPPALSGLRTEAPTTAATHENPKANPATMNGIAKPGQNPPWKRIPMMYPTPSMRQATKMFTRVSAYDPSAEEGGAGHRQRSIAVDHPFLEVLGESGAGLRGAEDRGLDEDAWHQEVDVGKITGRDGAAEDVIEEENEHDGRDRREDEEFGGAAVSNDVSPRHDGGVGEQIAELDSDG